MSLTMSFGTPENTENCVTRRRSLGMTRRRAILPQNNHKSKLIHSDKDSQSSISKRHDIQNLDNTNLIPQTDIPSVVDTPVRTTLIPSDQVQSLDNSMNENSVGLAQSPSPPKPSPKVCETSKSAGSATSPSIVQSSSGNTRTSNFDVKTPTSTPLNWSRTRLHRSNRKRFKADCNKPYKSLDRAAAGPSQEDTGEGSEVDITVLQEESTRLQQAIDALQAEGLDEAELQVHMKKMHEYNELKDMGQMLMGKIALMEGVTTKEIYNQFGLDLDD